MGMAIHIDHMEAEPSAYKALLGVSQYVASGEIDKKLKHLIDIRVSQINGCAFCLDMHTREARHAGETTQRIDTVAAWRDTPFFTPAERAALALAEHVTKISEGGVPESVAKELRESYSDKQIVQLLMAIIAINSWNRLSISTGKQPTAR